MTKTDVTIPLEEVASQIGGTPAYVLATYERLGIRPERDWAERDSISADEAHRVREAMREASKAAAELHKAFEAYTSDWKARQRDHGEQSFQEAIAREHQAQLEGLQPGGEYASITGSLPMPIGGGSYVRANEAAAAAREEFADKEPMLSFDEYERKLFQKGRRR
jgi:hypothetical protein